MIVINIFKAMNSVMDLYVLSGVDMNLFKGCSSESNYNKVLEVNGVTIRVGLVTSMVLSMNWFMFVSLTTLLYPYLCVKCMLVCTCMCIRGFGMGSYVS